MSAWFGGNLTSSLDTLRNQVSNSLKEVFEEEEPTDVGAQLMVAKERVEALTNLVEEQKKEIGKMKERNDELSEQKLAVEMQKEVQSNQFRELLREKEDELLVMSQSFMPDLSEHPRPEQPKVSVVPEFSSRVTELEQKLKEERETHQNEMMALQEALSNRSAKLHSPQSKSSADLLQNWHKDDHGERERAFFDALALLDLRQDQNGEENEHRSEELRVTVAKLEELLQEAIKEKSKYAEKCHLVELEAARLPELMILLGEKEAALADASMKLTDLTEKLQVDEQLIKELTVLKENNDLQKNMLESADETPIATLRAELLEKDETIECLRREKLELEQSLTVEQENTTKLASELELFEVLLREMKSEKEAMKKESEAGRELISGFQQHQQKMKESLKELETSLDEQVAHNKELEKSLELSESLNRSLQEGLKNMTDKSAEHAESLDGLRSQINAMQSTDAQVVEFKKLWDERQEEMDKLKSTLENKSTDVEKMNSETAVYKKQYEALLQEYNQYLEDLEALQSKAENLEKLKVLFEEEVELLKSNANKDKLSYEALSVKYEETAEREKKKDVALKSLEENVSNLESALFKERNRKRELENELDERDCLIEDLKLRKKKENHHHDKRVDEKEPGEEDVEVSSSSNRSLKESQQDREEEKELDESVADLENETSQQRLEEMGQRLEAALEEQRENRDQLAARVVHLENELRVAQEQLSEKTGEVEQQQTLNESLLAEVDAYKAEVDEDASKFEEQTMQLKSVEDQLQKYKEEVSDSSAKFQQNSLQLNALQEELDRCIEEMTAERAGLTTQKESLEEELESVKSALSVAEDRCHELTLEIDTLRESAKTERESEHLTTLQAEREELKTEVEVLRMEKETSAASWLAEKSQVLDVLNEKTRENSQLKTENAKLRHDFGEQMTKLTSHQDEEKEDMTKETVVKLSQLIRDKDAEVSMLHKEKQELYEALTQKHQESLNYYSEIQRLVEVNNSLQKQAPVNSDQSVHLTEKTVIDNSNEIIILKTKIKELERKLNIDKYATAGRNTSRASSQRKRFLSENLEENVELKESDQTSKLLASAADGRVQELLNTVENKNSIILEKETEILETHKMLQEREEELVRSQEELRGFKRKLESLDLHQTDSLRRIDELKFESENMLVENRKLTEENQGLISANNRFKVSLDEKEHDLEMARRNLLQLTEMLDEKSQNSESVQQERLHNLAAIQDLQSSLGTLKRERDEVNLRLAERDRELAETRREINNVIDKKRRLELELERLRDHLLAVEEGYTQEAMINEERERELRKKLQVTEEALRVSSVQHSTSSQESSVHVGSLQRQVKQLSEQRDQLLDKLGKVIQEHKSQEMALDNLTMVLEGFQREKDNDLKLAERDFRDRLQLENYKQSSLDAEIRQLQEKLEHANQGLAAASRLSEQLEKKVQVIVTLKQEIKLREELLKRVQSELGTVSTTNAGKVDKYLVKNLVVGYVSADASKKSEVLKIVATVLDFNQEERQKTGLEGSSNSWLGGWLGGGSSRSSVGRKATPSDVEKATGLDQSLAQAFIKFLESESTPKVEMKLNVSAMAEETTKRTMEEMNHSGSSGRSSVSTPTSVTEEGTSRQSPNPLMVFNSAHALPTFSVNRSSSSILKHVLQEERPSEQNN